jgi:hypothetical protein
MQRQTCCQAGLRTAQYSNCKAAAALLALIGRDVNREFNLLNANLVVPARCGFIVGTVNPEAVD